MRAAAPYQQRRRAELSAASGVSSAEISPDKPPVEPAVLQASVLIERWDVREKVRETKTGALILFVVDASGSMGAQRRMVAVKGAILSLLLDAYQRRDRVGMISFRGTSAEVLLPPTGSVDLAQIHLREMPTGGRTPLSRGLHLALEVVEIERMKDKQVLPLLVLLTDGRANVRSGFAAGEPEVPGKAPSGEAQFGGEPTPAAEAKAIAELVRERQVPALVIDTELDFIKLELARPIAEAMDAHYVKLDELQADSLAQAVRLQVPSALPPGRRQGGAAA
jgi:magnesium chelatase subunit D